jgi:hypothetical protein
MLLLPVVCSGGERGRYPSVELQYATNPGSPDSETILEGMAAYNRMKAENLRVFAVDRFYSVENKRVNKQSSLKAGMIYVAPEERLFEVRSFSGSSFMRKSILHRIIAAEQEAGREPTRTRVAVSPDNYTFALLREETVKGRRQYVLRASARRKDKLLFNGSLWVDAEDFAITRVVGRPARNPSFWTRQVDFVHEYEKFGPFWLSMRNTAVTKAFIFGRTTTLVEYSNYRINEPGLLEKAAEWRGRDARLEIRIHGKDR